MTTATINLSADEAVLPRFPSYGIGILESRHSKRFHMEESRYDFSEVMLIIGGKGWIQHGEVRHPLDKGSLILVEAGNSYHFEDHRAAPLAMLTLCLRHDSPARDFLSPVLPRSFAVLRHPHLARAATTHLRCILFEQAAPGKDGAGMVLAASLLLLTRLTRFRTGQGQTPEFSREKSGWQEGNAAARVKAYIEQMKNRFHEPVTIHTVAARLQMSPRTFTHYFRSLTGHSHHCYLRNLRLEQARHLLRDTDHSVTSVVFACGFEDLSTFFRAFRKETGSSPNHWREQARREEEGSPKS